MKPKAEKKKTWVYVKFAIIIVVCGLFGAACSMLIGSGFDGLSSLSDAISLGLYRAGVPLMALGLLLSAAATTLYLAAKKPMARADEDDEAYEKANRLLCLALILTTLGFPWFMLTAGLAFGRAIRSESIPLAGFGFGLLILQLVWLTALQALVIGATKKTLPGKAGQRVRHQIPQRLVRQLRRGGAEDHRRLQLFYLPGDEYALPYRDGGTAHGGFRLVHQRPVVRAAGRAVDDADPYLSAAQLLAATCKTQPLTSNTKRRNLS